MPGWSNCMKGNSLKDSARSVLTTAGFSGEISPDTAQEIGEHLQKYVAEFPVGTDRTPLVNLHLWLDVLHQAGYLSEEVFLSLRDNSIQAKLSEPIR